MSQLLIETIKSLNGELYNLPYHQSRFNLVRKNFLGCTDTVLLKDQIQVPDECKNGLFKCRVLYSEQIEKIEFLPHEYRTIQCLQVVKNDTIDYAYKYADREKLTELFIQRGDCDDILIVKNNCITDSYTANPVFFDGNEWWTPDTPLLPGTQRARLLSEGKLKVCRITLDDLGKYSKIGLINALQEIDNMPLMDVENIRR
ncbi:aminotransferase class IV [Maribellus sp. CM-23]|uniref:aminotransferase class IV n=1 Tax=Maribellus sp. CM-23 TaxID=2781026 RepID=UPI001F1B4718|nr:aminotransferase class IV [Maribellus sp. CM-23]MCE4564466.1 aminotransferase class IV [Maribellus sp. CM-23]